MQCGDERRHPPRTAHAPRQVVIAVVLVVLVVLVVVVVYNAFYGMQTLNDDVAQNEMA